MIEIDGSYGEGGGQIVRTSIAFSVLTGEPVRIFNIRNKRDPPGLKMQHLKSIELLAKISNSKVKNLRLGSEEITFVPGKIKEGNYSIDIGTAGSITLMLQAILPALFPEKKNFKIKIKGGTHVKWSPTVDYFDEVFLETLRKFGGRVDLELLKYGFYPKGGGSVVVRVYPSEFSYFDLSERGEKKDIFVRAVASKDLENREVAEREIKGFRKEFGSEFKSEKLYVNSLSTGTYIFAKATFQNSIIGFDLLGEKNVRAEEVGKKCAENFGEILSSEATVDDFLSDQLIPYLALYGGRFKFHEMTNHLKTNIWVCERFFGKKFSIDGNEIRTIT